MEGNIDRGDALFRDLERCVNILREYAEAHRDDVETHALAYTPRVNGRAENQALLERMEAKIKELGLAG